MALASKGTFLNVTLADAGGNRSNLRYQLSYADLTALDTNIMAVENILTHLAAVTDAAIVSYSVGEAFEEDTPANTWGAAGSEVEKVALTIHDIANELGKSATLRLPAPADGVFVGDGAPGPRKNEIDTADTALLTWLEHFSTTGEILVSDGEQIVVPSATNFKGKQIHRGSRKG